jgi:amino acid transporter
MAPIQVSERMSILAMRPQISPRHLALFAIRVVIGTRPIAQAAHGGPASVAMWLIAAVFVLMPLAIACPVLAARSPRSGGAVSVGPQ